MFIYKKSGRKWRKLNWEDGEMGEKEGSEGESEGVREREREREREKGKIQCLKDFLSHLYFIYRVVSPPNAGEPATITMQITPRNATTKSR